MVLLIYGAGAVGLGLGSCLLSAGAEVDLIGRQDTVSSLRQHGLLRTGIFGSYQLDDGGQVVWGDTWSRLQNLWPISLTLEGKGRYDDGSITRPSGM